VTALRDRPTSQAAEVQANESVVDALAAIVAANRNRAALRSQGREITYSEFWERTGAIAALLSPFRMAQPLHVALLLEQGIDAVCAKLGAVRAGMAYVAMDPMEPAERLRFILEDSSSKVVITSAALVSLAREICADDVPVLDVADAAAAPVAVEVPDIDGHDPAILVYTSGSTGQPKAVIQNHRNEVRYSATFGEQLDIRPGTRLSMLFSLSFGAANTDIYGGLLNAATLCLYDTRRLGVDGLPAWIDQERIEIFHTVPTVFRYVAEHAPPGGFQTVRNIELAGEPVFRSDVRKANVAFPRAQVANRYAATEITFVAQHVAGPGDAAGDGTLPAGTSPDFVDVFVRDEDGSPMPVGEVGEVVVRSGYLSPGYWRRPDLTARAFRDDPERPGMRRYHTGDAGRLDAQGVLTVVGRIDSRVKINGQSIEPAEVEGALRGLPGVSEAIIDVERGGEGNAEARLVGYVVLAESAGDLRVGDLRVALADRLPAHMLPSRLRIVAAFPQTRTGKVDRMALRELQDEPVPTEPLETETEERVAAIFAAILGVSIRSRRDDFFALGGSSLTLAQLRSQIRQQLGAELDLAKLLRSAAVADVAASLAEAADANGPAAGSELLVPLRTEGDKAPLFLIHGWHGQAFVTPGFIDAVPAAHPVYSFRARGIADGSTPLRSVTAMATEYLGAVESVGHARSPILVGICAGGVIGAEMARQRLAQGGDQLTIVMLNPPYPPQARPLRDRIRMAAFDAASSRLRWGPFRLARKYVTRRLRQRAVRLANQDIDAATLENDAAIEVALAVGTALRRHKPQRYDGPIHVIGTEQRLKRWAGEPWRDILTGDIQMIAVGEVHMDVINPENVAFRDALRQAIGAAEHRMEASA
jgi:amino acid adenylation domain-containing protein